LSKKIIFAVDDTETMLFVIEDALSADYTVIAMDSAEKMFKFLQRIKPDLILLDYYMPGMTFHETMKRLKNDPQYKNIPVVIISGASYPELLDEIYMMGASDFINKPFEDRDALLNIVEKWTATS
jgi:CheY-like chemotaxis protein